MFTQRNLDIHISDKINLHLYIFVAVGAVVNDRQRLLKACATDPDDISDQLTDCNHHLRKIKILSYSLLSLCC